MAKEKIGSMTYLYPMPVVMVGTKVGERVNYITVAYCGIVSHQPAMFAFASSKRHFTNAGVIENGTFSVNIPSEAMVAETDYVGMVSGAKEDKSTLFKTFYGELKTAPMIEECPLNLECRLVKTVDLGTDHDLFIGEIVETYADETCLTNGLPDIQKFNPFVFSMHDNRYWKIGELLGKAWSVGKGVR